jgi:diguanylate cyclase (GGDEF)-like protein
MLAPTANALTSLDITTLVIIATCIAALLGLLLLSAWAQEGIRALAWWGTAYLIGGFSVAIWSIESAISPPLPVGSASALLFVACGMIWSAARIFHGRPVLWGAMFAGAIVWLAAYLMPEFVQWPAVRMVLSSLIVATYTFLTAAELWRERRKTSLRRWPAIFVPILHGAVFLFPIPLASLRPDEPGLAGLATGWMAVFALEIMLYVVGTAFIVLVLAKERTVRIQRDAALTDELTGILNRRGFFAGAQQLVARQAKCRQPVSLLMFDLDHFKSINDRFGHAVGDETLSVFAATAARSLRASDVVARFGGEEFVAILPGSLSEAKTVAERVRAAFETAAGAVGGLPVAATVSVGAASAAADADVATLLTAADKALYEAKDRGRNRVVGFEEELPTLITTSRPSLAPDAGADDAVAWQVEPRPASVS